MFHWRAGILPGVSAAFTNSDAGNLALHVGDDPEAVRQRRARLEREIGVSTGSLRFMNQVHGTDVVLMDSISPAPEADAMVSRGTPLAVMVADCIPVILAGVSTDGPVLAVAHAGRPGLASGVIPATLESMASLGATGIRAWLGPSICGRCYEVPGAMQEEVVAAVPAARSTTSWGTPGLDLPAGARSQLENAGVTVEYSGPCTLETPSLYSYRRDRHTGRFAGLVWCHE
ncbi:MULTISPECIES: peptidoglycan editing factor PgeF [unclassified Pseudarthrobacter]|uniref:peptidoglycan editing factor PgeF n=1 Tax=unclassified Pseudarthrobacter TaxID=2647000 RepID=UPI0036323929